MSTLPPAGPAGPTVETRWRVLLPPPPINSVGEQAYRAMLLAWCRANRLDPARIAARGIQLNLTDRTVTYSRPLEQDDDLLPGERPWSSRHTQWREETRPLLAEAVGHLAGGTTCGYLEQQGETLLTCEVEVSPSGEHPGTHRTGDVEWLNRYPGVLTYHDGRPDVSGRTPETAHILTITALEHRDRSTLAGRRARDDLDAQAGRIRILYRHAPEAAAEAAGGGPRACTGSHAHAVWPCDDYLDAARGAVHGLETYR